MEKNNVFALPSSAKSKSEKHAKCSENSAGYTTKSAIKDTDKGVPVENILKGDTGWFYRKLVFTDHRLSLRCIKVLGLIISYADSTTGLCRVSRQILADESGISKTNISSTTNNLQHFGYLEKSEDERKMLVIHPDCHTYRDIVDEILELDSV